MESAATLPEIRDDLIVHPGPSNASGQPTWKLQDPARNQFFSIDWPAYEILVRWDYSSPSLIVEATNRETTLHVTLEDVDRIKEFLDSNCLIKRQDVADAMELGGRLDAGRKAWWTTLMHRYLFFRVPLINPDKWLNRWLFVGNLLFSRGFTLTTIVALSLALISVSQQWDVFKATLLDTFTVQGFMAYAGALVGVKIFHELGHGFMAKRHGCRVPVMGVAFLVLFPMAYTDTNEAWKVVDRRKRLAISIAGLRFELLVAAWATVLWVILPDGAMRSAAFFLASVSWVLSILLNISPFMRFDGYFILMDWMDFPNLHARSSAMARWWLRHVLFALKDQPPEAVSPSLKRILIAFAVCTWIYRFFLFIGIALLVYHAFTKVLGSVLFVVEIYWFILAPLIKELKVWWERHLEILASNRTKGTAGLIGLLFLVFVLPLPKQIHTSALIRPVSFSDIALSEPAMVKALPVRDGVSVEAGEKIIELLSPSLDFNLKTAGYRTDTAQWRLQAASLAEERGFSPRLAAEQKRLAATELESVQRKIAKLSFEAPHPGVFRLRDPDLKVGEWLPKEKTIATLVDPDQGLEILSWVDGYVLKQIEVGSQAKFFSQSHGAVLRGRVTEIEEDATEALPFPAMASIFGGEILVRESNGELVPERAIYRVVVSPNKTGVGNSTILHYGQLVLSTQPSSIGGQYLKNFLSILLKEAAP